jgi:hypothetical protein
MACLVMALRTDPQLRAMVEDLALAVMGVEPAQATGVANAQADAIQSLGYAADSEEARVLE